MESEPSNPAETKGQPVAAERQKKVKRHVLRRLFGISLWGWVKLLLLSVLVGFLVIASEFDPASPSVDVWATLKSFLSSSGVALRWAVTNFWQPALAGAGIVLPIWFLWRLISLPFRK
ncbi:MAG: hypothetical protein AAGI14_02040 [Pseudomonadota bacterium]